MPKDIKLFVQNEEDASVIRNAGFSNVEILKEDTVFEDIQIIKTKGEHGRGPLVEMAGQVCGVVFKYQSEKTNFISSWRYCLV